MEHSLVQLILAAKIIRREDPGLFIAIVDGIPITLDEVLERFVTLAKEKQCNIALTPE